MNSMWGAVLSGIVVHAFLAAYFYGRLTQKVADLIPRVSTLETKTETHGKLLVALGAPIQPKGTL